MKNLIIAPFIPSLLMKPRLMKSSLLCIVLSVLALINPMPALSEELSSEVKPVLPETVLPETMAPETPVALSVEELKKKVIKLNRDLFILEEDLLFPANTQFVVYLSLDTGQFLALDSVTLKVDDEVAAAHLYTDRQVKSLQRGGMQRLYMGNIKSGEHELTVIIDGIGPEQQAYKKAASLVIEKGTDIKSVEVRIQDQSSNFEPTVQLVEWD